jgi:hypothetical protein
VEQLDLPEDDGEHIADTIKAGGGRCMSDRSLKKLFGTSAFTFITNERNNRLSEQNTVPGLNIDQSSYRSELCGVLGNLIVINAICWYHQIEGQHEIIVGCDNESVLWNSLSHEPVTTKMPSFDLVAAIRHQIRTSPLTFKSKWVKGHQDSRKGVLDTWAIANIECDKQAERIWNQKEREGGERRPGVEGRMPGEKWVCYTKQGKISTKIDKQLYDNSKRAMMIDYWKKRRGWKRVRVRTSTGSHTPKRWLTSGPGEYGWQNIVLDGQALEK